MLFLKDSDVAASLSTAEALASQRAAYRAVVDGSGGLLGSAYAEDPATGAVLYMRSGRVTGSPVTVKAGMVQPLNTARSLPAVSALVVLLDPDTGQPLACMSGATLTLLRTAAGLAVAAEALALEGAEQLGVLGSGPQAEQAIRFLSAVRPIRRTTVWSPTQAHRDGLVARLQGEVAGEVVAADSARAAVTGHQVVVACTASRDPLVHGEWLAPGQTVLTMGSVEPDRREVDHATTLRATTFVDSLAQTLRSCGPVVEALAAGSRVATDFTEIGAVLTGDHPGRSSDDEIVVFHSVGVGHQDAAAALVVHRNAVAAGRGVALDT